MGDDAVKPSVLWSDENPSDSSPVSGDTEAKQP